jgi:two-component system, LytTR family, response regulator LytT
MKVLIVEDETVAYENLVDILSEIDVNIEVVGNTESISQTVQWLQTNPAPDIILMDIHLSDGSAFSIFEIIQVETPIVFTTASDEYAIEAFKVNSIDYLLKPIKSEELTRALQKFSKLTRAEKETIYGKYDSIIPTPKYKDRLLVPMKDKLLPLSLKNVACFYTTDKYTCIYSKDSICHPYSKTLEQIYLTLNPADFYRANKQFIISRECIKDITIWFDNRLLVTLEVETPERIFISKNKAAEFKNWVVNDA